MIRVALFETTHWHVPLYKAALMAADIDIVGVTDGAGLTGGAMAAEFFCPLYPSPTALLDAAAVDFAFVFGRHVDMPAMAALLIERGIPFAIEKPCGIRSADVQTLADAAERKGLFVAVPFIQRLADATEPLRTAGGGRLLHASFRFNGGAPGRYVAAGTPWMLDPALSGGGPLLNLGIHFVDLFRVLAGSEIVSVSAASTGSVHGLAIEDWIAMRMVTAAGQIGTIECGYSFPNDPDLQREFGFSMRTPEAYFQTRPDGILTRRLTEAGGLEQRVVPVRYETDLLYADFVVSVLDQFAAGRPPIAGLRDAAIALRLVEAAYQSARDGGTPIPVGGAA